MARRRRKSSHDIPLPIWMRDSDAVRLFFDVEPGDVPEVQYWQLLRVVRFWKGGLEADEAFSDWMNAYGTKFRGIAQKYGEYIESWSVRTLHESIAKGLRRYKRVGNASPLGFVENVVKNNYRDALKKSKRHLDNVAAFTDVEHEDEHPGRQRQLPRVLTERFSDDAEFLADLEKEFEGWQIDLIALFIDGWTVLEITERGEFSGLEVQATLPHLRNWMVLRNGTDLSQRGTPTIGSAASPRVTRRAKNGTA